MPAGFPRRWTCCRGRRRSCGQAACRGGMPGRAQLASQLLVPRSMDRATSPAQPHPPTDGVRLEERQLWQWPRPAGQLWGAVGGRQDAQQQDLQVCAHPRQHCIPAQRHAAAGSRGGECQLLSSVWQWWHTRAAWWHGSACCAHRTLHDLGHCLARSAFARVWGAAAAGPFLGLIRAQGARPRLYAAEPCTACFHCSPERVRMGVGHLPRQDASRVARGGEHASLGARATPRLTACTAAAAGASG